MDLIFNKILVFMICFSSINILRETYYFYQCFSKIEEYKISNKRMFGLWASLSYILTLIFTGI